MSSFTEAFERLDRFVIRKLENEGIPGLSLAITDRDQILHISTHGFADLSAGTLVTPEHLFEIGSISKGFTSIAILQLYEDDMLELHAPVTDYLPWFHVPSEYEPITIHHLLSHTAGLLRGAEFQDALYEVWVLREMEALSPPGTNYHYSNSGYKALGLILEAILAKPYGEVIKEKVLSPLGMDSTEPVITHRVRNRLTTGYEAFYDDRPSPRAGALTPATWFETSTGDGCIATTPKDMTSYLRMLLNHGQGPKERLISKKSFQSMTNSIVEANENGAGFYGYGYRIYGEDRNSYIGHGGGMVGYYSHILVDTRDGFGVAAFINGPGDPEDVALFALELMSASLHRGSMPDLPQIEQSHHIDCPSDYQGTYYAGSMELSLIVDGQRLHISHQDEFILLEQRGKDRFFIDHPDFNLFLIQFGRENGDVVELFMGPDWYINARYSGPKKFEYPKEWNALPGHYRSYNPWLSNFRIILRKGNLILIEPSGDELPLTFRDGNYFWIGEGPSCPEFICFDTILDGMAVQARRDGCDYYRTFTP